MMRHGRLRKPLQITHPLPPFQTVTKAVQTCSKPATLIRPPGRRRSPEASSVHPERGVLGRRGLGVVSEVSRRRDHDGSVEHCDLCEAGRWPAQCSATRLGLGYRSEAITVPVPMSSDGVDMSGLRSAPALGPRIDCARRTSASVLPSRALLQPRPVPNPQTTVVGSASLAYQAVPQVYGICPV